MKSQSKLAVIGEVFVAADGRATMDRSFNETLKEYVKYFDQVHYIGPGESHFILHRSDIPGVILSSYGKYSKRIIDRLSTLISISSLRMFIDEGLKDFRPNIVQVRIPAVFPLLAYRSLLTSDIPYVCYIGGDWNESLKQTFPFFGISYASRILRTFESSCIENSQVLMTAGDALAKKYLNKPTVVELATTHREVHKVSRSGVAKKILYVGRLERQKSVEDAIMALSYLVQRGLDFHLSVVGDGGLSNRLRTLCSKLSLNSHVTWHGQVTNSQLLAEIYSQNDILVLPSLSEGSPKVLPEAMSFGVIPIACRGVGSIDSIISDGVNGYKVDRKAPMQIADICQQIQSEPHLREALVHGAYAYAKNHTLQREVKKCWDYVLDLGL